VENYINANVIEVEGKHAIATQGPLTNSFHNFWRMVEQYNVTNIFMLCSLIEKNKIKCDRYYPQKDPHSSQLAEQEYEITLLEEEEVQHQKTLKLKRIQVKNNQTNQTRVVNHYQLTDWPDGDTPGKKGRKTLNLLIDAFLHCISEGETPVVHCSAGVGRTGTFIALCILRLQVANNQNISIFNLVRKLREQRWGMVHTLSQYEYLYDFAEK
jgi:tyrosine-protein phosphatase non-receptor type 12/18/22